MFSENNYSLSRLLPTHIQFFLVHVFAVKIEEKNRNQKMVLFQDLKTSENHENMYLLLTTPLLSFFLLTIQLSCRPCTRRIVFHQIKRNQESINKQWRSCWESWCSVYANPYTGISVFHIYFSLPYDAPPFLDFGYASGFHPSYSNFLTLSCCYSSAQNPPKNFYFTQSKRQNPGKDRQGPT